MNPCGSTEAIGIKKEGAGSAIAACQTTETKVGFIRFRSVSYYPNTS